MMKTLVAAIQKGGQGKTMVLTHLAFMAAEMGKKVLAVDLDGQGNFSCNLFADYKRKQSATIELFTGDRPAPLAVPLGAAVKGSIALLTGDNRLVEVDETPELMSQSLRDQLAQYQGFDLCLIDPPPTLGKRLRAALMASDYVVMPFVPARESVDGLGDLFDTIERVKQESNPKLHVLGLLPNKVNSRSNAESKIIQDIRDAASGMVLPLTVHERTSITSAMAASRPVWQGMGGESHRLAAKEVRAACQHILKCIFKK